MLFELIKYSTVVPCWPHQLGLSLNALMTFTTNAQVSGFNAMMAVVVLVILVSYRLDGIYYKFAGF